MLLYEPGRIDNKVICGMLGIVTPVAGVSYPKNYVQKDIPTKCVIASLWQNDNANTGLGHLDISGGATADIYTTEREP